MNYTVATPALATGTHTLCVTASGSDGGGPGSVVDCHTIHINAPPSVSAGGPYSGQEGSAVTIAGSVSDPDGPSPAQTWSIVPQSGVDAGATCSIANPRRRDHRGDLHR